MKPRTPHLRSASEGQKRGEQADAGWVRGNKWSDERVWRAPWSEPKQCWSSDISPEHSLPQGAHMKVFSRCLISPATPRPIGGPPRPPPRPWKPPRPRPIREVCRANKGGRATAFSAPSRSDAAPRLPFRIGQLGARPHEQPDANYEAQAVVCYSVCCLNREGARDGSRKLS